jgi:PAS domain S-box-containing protein
MHNFLSPDAESGAGYLPKEVLYHKMIDEVEDYAILMMDPQGNILNWNKGAEKIKGYKEHEIVSKNFRLFYTKEDRENHLPEMLLKQGFKNGKALHEGWRVRKDGTRFWGSIVITAIHDDHGAVIGFTKVTRDLTERKIAEDSAKAQAVELARKNEELVLAKQQIENNLEEIKEANKELEKFAYIVSHDLQEPVRKITTYFSLLCKLNETSFDEKSEELKQKIIQSATRMTSLITDLLSLSTISQKVSLHPVDLNKVIAQALEDLEMSIADKRAIIEVENLPIVQGVESFLLQLFLNLLTNSLKFTRQTPYIQISASMDGNNAIIKLKDNGIGIEEKQFTQIFKPFERLHSKKDFEGTGIGLAICKRIVDVLRGTIAVESKVEEGTTFTITLGL